MLKGWATVHRWPTAFLRASGLAVLCGIVLGACGQPSVENGPQSAQAESATATAVAEPPGPGVDEAATRAVRVSTTACGYAPSTDGSGILIGANSVLTAAHVVGGAGEISISMPAPDASDDEPIPGYRGTVVVYDTLRDLAVIRVDGGSLPTAIDAPPPLTDLAEGADGVIVDAATSGDVPFRVTDKTIIEIDEVRGSRRSQRSGYLLAAVTAPGDSGSGLYDLEGRLAGLLFAVSTDDQGRSWATAASEIGDFLADQSLAGEFACDPDRSRLAANE